MRRRKNLWISGILCVLLMAGCGNATVEEVTEESPMEETVSMETQESEPETESEEPEVTAEPVKEIVFEEDPALYGNSAGNILNGGLYLEDDQYIYLYHGYDNCVYRAEKVTGISEKIVDGYFVNLNLVDGMLYGCRADEAGTYIQEVSLETGESTVLYEGNVGYVMAVDREIYFLDYSAGSIKKISLDTREESLVAEQVAASAYAIYKGRVYYSSDSDKGALYSVPREGGETVKLNDVLTYMPGVYRDKIYYLGMENGAYTIRSMELDGSGDTVLAGVDAGAMNLYGGKLYYVDNNATNQMYCMDLDTEEPVITQVNLEAQIKTALDKYALEPVSDYRLDVYMGMNLQQDHMVLMCYETMDGIQYMDQYLYDFESDQIMPVAYFFVDREVLEAALRDSSAGAKEKEPVGDTVAPASGSQEQTPSRSYPPGNYNTGSVYGPRLSRSELDQVADAVQLYLDSYDFASMGDYDKVATAHDYLCNICQFAADWRYNQANTAWGALVYGEAQCSGYARAMKALCDAMGVDCYYVHADENASNPSHQWNEVCIDGNWYIIDVQANDKSGFLAFYLISDDTYASMSGMSWDRSSVPACPADYSGW